MLFYIEQPLDAISLDLSSNVPKHAASLLDENEMLSNFDSSISIKEETKESSITGKCTGSNLSLKLQEKKSNYPETIKVHSVPFLLEFTLMPDSLQICSKV
jgi:hypothetical protein